MNDTFATLADFLLCIAIATAALVAITMACVAGGSATAVTLTCAATLATAALTATGVVVMVVTFTGRIGRCVVVWVVDSTTTAVVMVMRWTFADTATNGGDESAARATDTPTNITARVIFGYFSVRRGCSWFTVSFLIYISNVRNFIWSRVAEVAIVVGDWAVDNCHWAAIVIGGRARYRGGIRMKRMRGVSGEYCRSAVSRGSRAAVLVPAGTGTNARSRCCHSAVVEAVNINLIIQKKNIR